MRLDAKIGVEVVGVASTVVESALVVYSAVTSIEDSTMVEEIMSSARVSDEVVVGYSIVAYGIVSSARDSAEAVDSTMVEEVGSGAKVSDEAMAVGSAVTSIADSTIVEEIMSRARVSDEAMAVYSAVTSIADSTMVEEIMSRARVSDEAIVGYSIMAYGIVSNTRLSTGGTAVDMVVVEGVVFNTGSAETIVGVD